MGNNQAAFFLFFFSLVLLIEAQSSSDTSVLTGQLQVATMRTMVNKNDPRAEETGYGLVQNIRAGHGDGPSGGGGQGGSHGDGNGDSSSGTQPGRPLNGAGTANNHNHHQRGVAINSPACNFSLLTVAISLSLCASFYI